MTHWFTLLFYRCFLILLSPVILALFFIRSRKNTAYRQRLLERLGFLPRTLRDGGIVVHAASVGEVIAIKAFVEKLIQHYPTLPITITTYTPTGSEQVKKLFNDRVQHCYFPLDIIFCSTLFLNKLKPKAIVFMETEIWPNIIAQSASRGTKLLLINGRLSQHSIKSYQKLAWLITPTLKRFNHILTQSHNNLNNFLSVGAQPQHCSVSGNLKFDIAINQNITDKQAELAKLLPNNRPIWLMASTHQGDEAIALQAFNQIKAHHPDLLLILVPRHPERFDLVEKLCLNQNYVVMRRSKNIPVTPDTQIWLLDSLGELMPTYALSSIITMGGSFSHIGGHNPLEPALFKKPIIVGPDMKNFAEVFQQLNQSQAIEQLNPHNQTTTIAASNNQVTEGLTSEPSKAQNRALASTLAETVHTLLQQPQQQQMLGENAYRVVLANQGASERSCQQLTSLLNEKITYPVIQKGNSYCVYNANLIDDFSSQMLTSDYWVNQNLVEGTAQGRGTTWFVRYNNQQWVLRHYYRGGLIGKFNNDSYCFITQQTTRAAKEFRLLTLMQAWQLPAPQPVAYRVVRHGLGLTYQADLLTSRITNAKDLVALLTQTTLSTEIWHHIGATIKRFHEKGIYHHDLNAHNILLNHENIAWLIDFDQGEQRRPEQSWQQGNLQRLLRSFRKEKAQLPDFYWQEENWSMLLKGYEKTN